jgi:hypothetical protein
LSQRRKYVNPYTSRLWTTDKQIDPLDNLKDALPSKNKALKLNKIATKISPESPRRRTSEEIETELKRSEENRQTRLSTDLYLSFIVLLDQLVSRVSLVALTFHVMMMIPLLQYLKINLGVSITPFLYIGPFVLLVPYIAYFLWEYNLVSIPIIDLKLKDVLYKQKRLAEELLRNNQVELLNSATNQLDVSIEGDRRDLNKLILARLLAKMDVDVLYTDVMSCRPGSSGSVYQAVLSRLPVRLLSSILNSQNPQSSNKAAIDDNIALAVRELLVKMYNGKGSPRSSQDVLNDLREMKRNMEADDAVVIQNPKSKDNAQK